MCEPHAHTDQITQVPTEQNTGLGRTNLFYVHLLYISCGSTVVLCLPAAPPFSPDSRFFPLTVLDCPALTLQSSRSLDALSDLKLQRLEAELEGARHEAQGACQREEELKAECERLKDEMRELQSSQRERVSVDCSKSALNTAGQEMTCDAVPDFILSNQTLSIKHFSHNNNAKCFTLINKNYKIHKMPLNLLTPNTWHNET